MIDNSQYLNVNGIPVAIIEPIMCTKDVTRTWKERLFTLPFTPFNKFKKEVYWQDMMGYGEVVKNENTLFMSAKTWHKYESCINSK